MPDDLVWQQEGEQAQLLCGPWQARVNALRPADGLSDVSFYGVPLSESTFLGVDLELSDRAVLGDCYQRGGDLIVRYLQTEARPFAATVYWRAGWFEHEGQSYPRIDLVVSVETSLLDSRPRLSAVSNLKLATGSLVYSGDGYLLAPVRDATEIRYSEFESEGPEPSGPSRGFRAGICYAEMCHPDDLLSASIETPPAGTAAQGQETLANSQHARCLTRLFGQPLEKGVILRSRVRGVFVPRDRSDEIARAALADLVGSALPLTT